MSNLSSLITQTVGSSAGGVNLITAPSSASIWTGTGGVTVTTTTTAAELPLEGFSSTAVKFALSASTGTAYCDFDCPTALQNFLLQLLWYSRASSAFTASITLSINSYSSSGNRTSNTSPTVVTPQVSAIIGAGINFETNFVSTSNQYLRLTLSFGAQASAWYSIAQFGIGPSNRTQGPALNDVTLTPTVIGATNGSAYTNTTVTNCVGVRVGSWLEVTGKLSFSGLPATGTGAIVVRISTSGLTLDSTKSQNWNGSGAFYDSSTANIYNLSPAPYMTSTNLDMQFSLSGETGTNLTLNPASIPVAFANGDLLNFSVRLPISEWASSALNLGPGAQVEYASGAITSDANTTTTIYGPAGSRVPTAALSVNRYAEITWQYPRQNDDVFFIEIDYNGDGRWAPFDANEYGSFAYVGQGTTAYGMLLTHTTTTTRVAFYPYATVGTGLFGTAGAEWRNLAATIRWRVRKAKASSPVGFGLAGTDGSAGLYKPGSAPGLIPTSTTITAAPLAGYIGETLEASGGTLGSTSIGSTGANTSICGVTLTPGVWEVQGGFYLVAGATTAWTTATWGISSTNNAVDSLSKGGAGQSHGLQTICPVNQAFLATTGTRRFNVTTNTPVYLVGSITYTVLGGASYSASDYIKAVRIA